MAKEYKKNAKTVGKGRNEKKGRNCWDKKAIVWRKKMRIIKEVNIDENNKACYLKLKKHWQKYIFEDK